MQALGSQCVYFPVETTGREFAGHILLGTRLASQGMTVVIGHKNTVARLIHEAPGNGVVFYKGDARLSLFHRLDFAYVGQDPETGLSWSHFEDFVDARPLVFGRLSSSSAYFAYGPRDYSVLQLRFPEISQKIYLAGSARTMLWGTPGDAFYSAEVAQIQERYGPLCLVVSGGGRGDRFNRNQSAEGKAQLEGNAASLLQKALAVRQATGLSVVIRPHPSESWLQWKRDVRGIAGIFVETCFDLGAWVRAAEFVIQAPQSTAAFEAWLAGTPSVADGAHTSAAGNGHRRIYDAHRLCVPPHVWEKPFDYSAILSEHSALRNSKELDALIQDRIFAHNEDVTLGIAQEITRVAEEVRAERIRPSLGLAVRERLRLHGLGRLFHQERLGRRTPPPFKRWALSQNRVRGAVERSARVLGVSSTVECRLLLPNCVELRSA